MKNDNKLPLSQMVIVAFVTLAIFGMAAFTFSDSFKSLTSISKKGHSLIEKIKTQFNKDNNSKNDLSNKMDNNELNTENQMSIKEEYLKAYKALNRAFEKEYKLYGNLTVKNGVSASKQKLIEMVKNQMTIIEDIDDHDIFKTTDGVYQIWYSANKIGNVGFNIYTRMEYEEWRGTSQCHSAKECEKLNPNAFSTVDDCGRDTDYRFCPGDNSGYSYVYNVPLKEVFKKFPDGYPMYRHDFD